MNESNGMSDSSGIPTSIMDAIYMRRSVRDYNSSNLSEASIHALLYAAIQAPTAMLREFWGFAVIQDKKLLNLLSEDAKKLIQKKDSRSNISMAKHYMQLSRISSFDIFYNATTLIIIYGKTKAPFVAADCWLAAENLMLASYVARLGSCVIGLALPALNTPKWKKALNIPDDMTAYAPIIVGYPAGETLSPSRTPPNILFWEKSLLI